jgi:hypothetical protein
VRESAKTSRKTIAGEAERNRRRELEKTLSGIPIEKRENRIRSVSDVVKAYEGHYSINHREQSVQFSSSRLVHVKRLLGAALLPDLTEDAVRSYIRTRLTEGAGGRTINMALGRTVSCGRSQGVRLVAEGPASWKNRGEAYGGGCAFPGTVA